jgi:hypothetical protein
VFTYPIQYVLKHRVMNGAATDGAVRLLIAYSGLQFIRLLAQIGAGFKKDTHRPARVGISYDVEAAIFLPGVRQEGEPL